MTEFSDVTREAMARALESPSVEWAVHAASAPADDRTRVLKDGETFAVFDHYGDIQSLGLGEQGLYHHGTRHLSQFDLRLAHKRPLLLASSLTADNSRLTVDLTNPEFLGDGGEVVPAETIHVARTLFLWDGVCHERLDVQNYGPRPVRLSLTHRFEADFRDIFEVRGTRRARRGQVLAPASRPSGLRLGYVGLDDQERSTVIVASSARRSDEGIESPAQVVGTTLDRRLELGPGAAVSLLLTIECASVAEPVAVESPEYDSALAALTAERRTDLDRGCTIESSNQHLNRWLERSRADLVMLSTRNESGAYPYAGIPWFSTPFGRDGIVAALETLWVDPELAASVLRYLAATQAQTLEPTRDAAPGKILHEARSGEMAALGEVPFGRYYGSVDATPLFVILAGAYFEATADRALIEHLWPHIELALSWIDDFGDPDHDGFVEYSQNQEGLIHQGWKDSFDSVFHADGSEPQGPIALCEVQAYVYAARLAAARIADALERHGVAERLRTEAGALRERFDSVFWLEDSRTYALALDGAKQRCEVASSNAGHTLFGGIASTEHASALAESLLSSDLFSGWGIRTIGAEESRYNPMSYHNGSVWPHDNALIADGLARYGHKREVLRILDAFYDASQALEQRLPELICGFPRRADGPPIRYPVANSPQAWSAGAVFMLLRAALGMTIDGERQRVSFDHPVLPEWLETLHLRGLRVGAGTVDLDMHRVTEDNVVVVAVRRVGTVEVLTLK